MAVSMDEHKAEGRSGGGFSLTAFAQETRNEIAKVTWPTRKETMVTTVLIVAMALAAGVFFLAVDSALGFAVSRVLGMSS